MGFLSWLLGADDETDEQKINKIAEEAASAWEKYSKHNDKAALQEYREKQAELKKELGKT